MTHHAPRLVPILGTGIHVFDSPHDALDLIRKRIVARERTWCVAINPEKVYRANRDARLQNALDLATVRICDGVGISIAAMLLHGTRLPRCTGVDLFMSLIDLCETEGWRVFLLGASPGSNAAARCALADRFPGLRIAGSEHGYVDDATAVVKRINDSGADLLFVAMGSPRQEYWISEHLPQLNAPFCMGIGGALDVLSGFAKRAPRLFRQTGTEWLFRLLANPARFRRQIALPGFATDVLRLAINGGAARRGSRAV